MTEAAPKRGRARRLASAGAIMDAAATLFLRNGDPAELDRIAAAGVRAFLSAYAPR